MLSFLIASQFALATLGILILYFVLRPYRRDILCESEDAAPEINYDELAEFMDEDRKDFWKHTGGLRGIWRRLRIAYRYSRRVQVSRRAQRIKRSEAWKIWTKLLCQALYSLGAVPGAAICHIIPTYNHRSAKIAMRHYCDLILRTDVLCAC